MKKLLLLAVVAIAGWVTVGYLLTRPPEVRTFVETKTETVVPEGESLSSRQRPLIDYINHLRAKEGLSALVMSDNLNRSAMAKTEDMANLNYWSHERPDGEKFSSVIWKHAPEFVGIGENLAKCFTTYEATMTGWKNSPGHLKNMIDPDYTHFGSATMWDEDQKCFITVTHFGY